MTDTPKPPETVSRPSTVSDIVDIRCGTDGFPDAWSVGLWACRLLAVSLVADFHRVTGPEYCQSPDEAAR